MLDNETKRRIDTARDILVGKVPDPKSQVEQITIALIYKFMDDMDAESEELGGKRKFFSGEYERYSWKKLMAPSLGGFEVLTLYAEAIQKLNINPNIPQLFRDIFKNAYLPYRDPQTLKSFLKTIDEFDYDHSEKLGDAFEYLLSVLGSQGDAGQFRTPRHIIDFMVYLVDPKKNETILDPACGTAGFLISSYKHIVKSNSSNFNADEQNDFSFGNLNGERYSGDKLTPDERKRLAFNIKGYDISPDMVRLSLVNLYLHGFADPKISEYDTLTSEERWNEHSDIILANPPFMSPKGGIKPHKRFSVESNRSEVLFVDYIAEHLTPSGRAAVIVPEGIIFQSGTAYKALRKMLVESYLYAVISLPAGVFNPYSGVKTSILLMDKTLAKKTDKILFAKVDNEGFDLGAQRRANDKSELPTIANAVKDFAQSILNRTVFDVDLYKKLVIATKEKIGENGDWGLSGERYSEEKVSCTSFELVSISEIAKVESGFGFPLEKQGRKTEIYPFLKVSDMNLLGNEQYIKTWNHSINEEDITELKLKIFPKNTIIFPKIGAAIATNKKRILSTPSTYDNNVMGLIPDPQKIDYRYLYSILQSINISIWASESAPPSMKKSTVENYRIPLPPLEIQQEIVAEIEGWQKIIDGARQVVENYKPQIEIDPSWEMVELGEVCEFIDYRGKTPLKTESGIRLVTAKNVKKGFVSIYPEEFIAESDFDLWMTRGLPQKGDVLFTTEAPLGNVAQIESDEKLAFAQRLITLVPDRNRLNDSFLMNVLLSDEIQSTIFQHQSGSTVYGIKASVLKTIKIPIPNLEIQNKLVHLINREKCLISGTNQLISLFELKIKSKISAIWGE